MFTSQTVDTSDNSTAITTDKCRVRGVYVNTVLSAHTVVIEDAAGTALFTLPASLAAGSQIDLGDVVAVGLTVNPNDSSTGNITIMYEVID